MAHASPGAGASPIDAIGDAIAGSAAGSAIQVVPIRVQGSSHSYYVEHNREDALQEIERQEVWQLYQAGDEVRLRVNGFVRDGGQRLQIGGMWLVPEMLPALAPAELYPKFEMVVTPGEDGSFTAATPHRYPTSDWGATWMDSSMEVGPESMVWHGTGYASDGSVVWTDDGAGWRFERFEPDARAERRQVEVPANPRIPNAESVEAMLVILHLHEGEGQPAETGDTIAMSYAGWNGAGELFDTSRVDWREPYSVTLPGRVIVGWQEGLKGIRVGETRRLIIPPALAYGPQRRSAQIGPNETLYFDVECVSMTPAPAAEGGGG